MGYKLTKVKALKVTDSSLISVSLAHVKKAFCPILKPSKALYLRDVKQFVIIM